MKKFQRFTALLLALCLLAALPLNASALYYLDPPGDVPVPAPSTEEKIVPDDLREALGEPVWYSRAVYDLWYAGVLSGTGETAEIGSLGTMRLFRPNQAVTREQFLVMLYNLNAAVAVGDLDPGDPYFDWQPAPEDHVSGYAVQAVRRALSRGIVTGDGESLRGTSPITRQEMAAMLMRAAGDDALKLEDGERASFLIADEEEIAPWAREAMRWAHEKGLLQGTGLTFVCQMQEIDGQILFAERYADRLAPRKTVTRAEAAQVLWAYHKAFGGTFWRAETWENVFSYYALRLS